MGAVLEVADLSLQRAGGGAITLPSLCLSPGEAAVLVGPSGCGKSTILRALFSLPPCAGLTATGTVRFEGQDVGALAAADVRTLLRTRVAFLVQDAASALDPVRTIGDQMRAATQRDAAACRAALLELSVDDQDRVLRRFPHQISGGQAQRVLVAVACLRQPALVVADEPTANLDDRTCQIVALRLRDLRARGSAVLVATHDERLRSMLAAPVLVARDGAFVPEARAVETFARRSSEVENSAPPILSVRGLCVRLGHRLVLSALDFDLHRGEVLAVVGESGSGKTTLARALAGRIALAGGSIERPSRPFSVQLLSQDAAESLTPTRTLRSLLAEATAPGFDLAASLDPLKLSALLDRTRAQMSVGERRRAALLRAIAARPDVLVLDEPTASLDHAAARALVDLLLSLRERTGVAIVVITHDTELAAAIGHRVLTLAATPP
ncbi:MAG: ATP-binding cassette domain-containing protein [Planctomycetota bacterium]